MFAADYYFCGNKNFRLAYFNHGTPQAYVMRDVVLNFAEKNKIQFVEGKLTRERDRKESPEEFYRNERYRWLSSLGFDIVTAHNLGDQVEQWLFSSLHGNLNLMKGCSMISFYGQNATLYRPFITNTKQQLTDWCIRHNVSWCEDESNKDTKYPRNFIRHELLAQCLKVNPGLANTIRKKILKEHVQ